MIHKGQFLLGERINAHGAGTWCPPGGHLEYGERPQDCASRELAEETGLVAEEVVSGPWTNDVFTSESKHYVTLYMMVPRFMGVASVKEPEKCLRWQWFAWDQLPSPLFLSLSNLVKTNSLEALLSDYLLCVKL